MSQLLLLSALLLSGAGNVLADKFTLTSDAYNISLWEAQPYVANGYIGQRVPATGSGYYQIVPINASADDGTSGWPLFDPRFTAAMVAGFYDQQASTSGTNFAQTGGEQPISTLPTWSSLYITYNSTSLSPAVDPSTISSYSQSLSLTTGLVTTSYKWQGLSITYTIFAHRENANLGVVRLDVGGIKDDYNFTVTDVLDGAGSWRTTPVDAGVYPNASNTIYSAVQPNGITNVTAYEYSILNSPTGKLQVVNSTSDCYSASTNSSTASQCYSLTSPHSSQTFVKFVGIASTDAFSDPSKTALSAAQSGLSTGYSELLKTHESAWNDIWDDADIEIGGSSDVEKELQLAARASLFHILSNVRQGSEGHGLGDNSIAPAGITSDSYAGQIFWDADTWMFPGLNALFPNYAESIVNYRYRQLGAAEENSKQYNRSGALYPWTGARFGNCTGVGPCYDYEYHLENDISLAQFQYYAGSQNETWLRERGWPVIKELAEFWASQVIYNSTDGEYATLNETDPDEYANFRNNAAFTNAGVSVTLNNAIELAKIIGETPSSNWSKIANDITILKDPTSNITLEYQGFNGTTAVKQADVVLLPYPLAYPQSSSSALQDLNYYSISTSANGPGMTYSIFSIDSSELSTIGCASYTWLLASGQPYSRGPFYQFSEQTTDNYATNGGTNPAFTFLTAHGGFLQTLTHGFTGYRSRLGSLYLDPSLPPQLSSGYTLKGFKWGSSSFDITVGYDDTTIKRVSGTGLVNVEISASNSEAGNYSLSVGSTLKVPTRHTSGTLVADNIAQCTTVLNGNDTSFLSQDGTSSPVVPGQYTFAAIDGSNATLWQPITDASSSILVDLGSSQKIDGFHFNWGSNPAIRYEVWAGTEESNLKSLINGTTEINAPYDSQTANNVEIRIGNTTDVSLSSTLSARYVQVAIEGSWLGDGKGGTLAEFAVLSASTSSD